MIVVVILVIAFALLWAKQNLEIAKLCKGLSPDHKKVMKYLFGGMLVFGKITDEQYDEMVQAKLKSLNLKKKALDKIGLDESQVNEIAPINIQGFDLSNDVKKARRYAIYNGKDNVARSTQYEAVWLFFSDTQVYMYKYHFDMLSDNKKEITEEYFYKDITNFSTSDETVEVTKYKQTLSGKKPDKTYTRDYSRFSLAVTSGDKFYCSTTNTNNVDDTINAMKQKLREKKNA